MTPRLGGRSIISNLDTSCVGSQRGVLLEYYYKLASKLVHPTSFLLANLELVTDLPRDDTVFYRRNFCQCSLLCSDKLIATAFSTGVYEGFPEDLRDTIREYFKPRVKT